MSLAFDPKINPYSTPSFLNTAEAIEMEAAAANATCLSDEEMVETCNKKRPVLIKLYKKAVQSEDERLKELCTRLMFEVKEIETKQMAKGLLCRLLSKLLVSSATLRNLFFEIIPDTKENTQK